MKGSVRLGTIFGIPFYVNYSWFLILALVTLSYAGEFVSRFNLENSPLPWVLGFISALFLFGSVLAHELGHSLVALSQNIEVKSITLFLFGGLASLEKESKTPLEAFAVAIAGPLVSFGLFGAISILRITLPDALSVVDYALYNLATLNFFLAVFNMIPGLPLDGGNVLKSIVWQLTKNPAQGIIVASRSGQLLAGLGMVYSLFGILGQNDFGNIWTLLVSWFVLQNAQLSWQYGQLQRALSNHDAQDAIIAHSPIVDGQLTLREFANRYVIGQDQWHKFLVVDQAQQLLGTITRESINTVSTSEWVTVKVQELTVATTKLGVVKSHDSLFEIWQTLKPNSSKQLTVVNDRGEVLGLLDRQSILELMAKEFKTQTPKNN